MKMKLFTVAMLSMLAVSGAAHAEDAKPQTHAGFKKAQRHLEEIQSRCEKEYGTDQAKVNKCIADKGDELKTNK